MIARNDPLVTTLKPAHGWAALNLRDIWRYRELVYFLTWRDLKVRYKQTLLGTSWAVLRPVLTMVVFSIFFGSLAKVPSEGVPYPILHILSAVTVGTLRHGPNRGQPVTCSKQPDDYQGLFPPNHPAAVLRFGRCGGFFSRFCGFDPPDDLLRIAPNQPGLDTTTLPAANPGECIGRWLLALCFECTLSGCGLCHPIPEPVLVVHHPDRLWSRPRPGTMAVPLCAQPDGGGCEWISMGDPGD